MQSNNPNNGSGGQHFIQYQQQPTSSIPDSQGLFPDQQNSQNQLAMNNESIMGDSCVMYDEPN